MPSFRFVAVAILSITASPLHAQRLAVPFTAYRAGSSPLGTQLGSPGVLPFPVESRAPDRRWEGFAVGGGLLGVAGALLAHGLCKQNDQANPPSCVGPTISGGLVGGLIGGVVGLFIGSSIPKTS
jgi:hypothetical protein